jgi:predicted PurR-regulated permease PerM
MKEKSVLIELLRSRPEFLLMILLMVLVTVMVVFVAIASVAFPGLGKRRFVEELLKNPAVQERIKDPNLDFQQFIEQVLKSADQAAEVAQPKKMGLVTKIFHDITWDVAGIIGLIVTIVLMFMVVSRSYADMPREIVAGWTIILGYYFGKAVAIERAQQP